MPQAADRFPTPAALARLLPLLRPAGGGPGDAVLGDDCARIRFEPLGPEARIEGGVVDLLSGGFAPTFTQRLLDTRLSAWAYDRTRDALAPALGVPRFPDEVARMTERLALAPGDVVLDVACGHGNFTVEIARRVGPGGLVVGLDIAGAMLARAARRVRAAGLANVVLLRADALALPFAGGALARVNCAGGLHQLPDLGRAVSELARVTAPGARVALSGFARRNDARPSGLRARLGRGPALHVVSLDALATDLAKAGFEDVATETAGPAMGYAWARRGSALRAAGAPRSSAAHPARRPSQPRGFPPADTARSLSSREPTAMLRHISDAVLDLRVTGVQLVPGPDAESRFYTAFGVERGSVRARVLWACHYRYAADQPDFAQLPALLRDDAAAPAAP